MILVPQNDADSKIKTNPTVAVDGNVNVLMKGDAVDDQIIFIIKTPFETCRQRFQVKKYFFCPVKNAWCKV
uniref:Uncharacterized protein n=1 Tax=Romanomermis culicivorax TaxID=13658 RepID=A0A915IJ04_ROMCU